MYLPTQGIRRILIGFLRIQFVKADSKSNSIRAIGVEVSFQWVEKVDVEPTLIIHLTVLCQGYDLKLN